jgi:hypothetical protein
LNVRGLPNVLPHSMPPIGEESDEQTRAYRKNQMNAEEAGPARGAAGRYDPKRSSLRTWMFAIARKGTSRLGGEQVRGGVAHGAVEEGSDLEEFRETSGLDLR